MQSMKIAITRLAGKGILSAFDFLDDGGAGVFSDAEASASRVGSQAIATLYRVGIVCFVIAFILALLGVMFGSVFGTRTDGKEKIKKVFVGIAIFMGSVSMVTTVIAIASSF